MRHIKLIGLVLVMILLAPALVSAQAQQIVVNLAELNDSGISGTATLTPMGDQTEVVVKLQGDMLDTPRPNHIHTGTCENLGGVEYPLTNVTTEATTVVDASLESLMSGEFAINIHKSADEIGTFVACGNIPAMMPAQEVTPSVTVSDQTLEDSTVTIDEVIAAEAGWLVIHKEAEGNPGPVIGYTAVQAGENTNVVVEIDAAAATTTLFAMLHVDKGEMGTYEFPGADAPVQVNEQVVVRPFKVMPATLPKTGGASTAWLIVMAAGLFLLLAGFATRRAAV